MPIRHAIIGEDGRSGLRRHRGYGVNRSPPSPAAPPRQGMCMAYYESRYTTNASYDNGWSTDYGIFQINSYWWCNDGKTSGAVGGCSISCNSLMNDDITDDITCAKRVVRDPNGMGAWVAWNNYCKNKDVSSFISGCAL